MDNILSNLPNKYVRNYNLVEISNKLTFGSININNLKLLGKYFNHLHLNNLHGKKINISPVKSNGLFNVFQINNYNIDFTFKVNHVHQKVKSDITTKFFEKVKSLERTMENYQTGLHIKCYNKLNLEKFEVDSLEAGEQIIYFKDCIINENLILNLSGRSMVILDNTAVHGVVKFNMKTKVKPIYLKQLKNVSSESVTKSQKNNKLSTNNNLMYIIIAVLILGGGIYFMNKNKAVDVLNQEE